MLELAPHHIISWLDKTAINQTLTRVDGGVQLCLRDLILFEVGGKNSCLPDCIFSCYLFPSNRATRQITLMWLNR